jgi:hypothetical protein
MLPTALKMGKAGSVEEYRSPVDHEIASQDDKSESTDQFQTNFCLPEVSDSAFNHREDGLHLDSFPISPNVNADLR